MFFSEMLLIGTTSHWKVSKKILYPFGFVIQNVPHLPLCLLPGNHDILEIYEIYIPNIYVPAVRSTAFYILSQYSSKGRAVATLYPLLESYSIWPTLPFICLHTAVAVPRLSHKSKRFIYRGQPGPMSKESVITDCQSWTKGNTSYVNCECQRVSNTA